MYPPSHRIPCVYVLREDPIPYGLRFPEDFVACSLVNQAVIGHEHRLVLVATTHVFAKLRGFSWGGAIHKRNERSKRTPTHSSKAGLVGNWNSILNSRMHAGHNIIQDNV